MCFDWLMELSKWRKQRSLSILLTSKYCKNYSFIQELLLRYRVILVYITGSYGVNIQVRVHGPEIGQLLVIDFSITCKWKLSSESVTITMRMAFVQVVKLSVTNNSSPSTCIFAMYMYFIPDHCFVPEIDKKCTIV